MKSRNKAYKYLRALLRYMLHWPLREKSFFIRIALLSFVSRMLVLYVPMRQWLRWVEQKKHLHQVPENLDYRLNRCLNILQKVGLWEVNCLNRAMVQRKIYKSMNIQNQMVFGLRKNNKGELEAHAWMEYGGDENHQTLDYKKVHFV